MTIAFVTIFCFVAAYIAGLFTAYRLMAMALDRQTEDYGRVTAQRDSLLDRLLLKHGQTPLSEPVSTPKPLEQAPALTLYQQRILEGAREDEEESRRFRSIPLTDEQKEELAEEARRRA